MKFGLGRSRQSSRASFQEEALRRWRDNVPTDDEVASLPGLSTVDEEMFQLGTTQDLSSTLTAGEVTSSVSYTSSQASQASQAPQTRSAAQTIARRSKPLTAEEDLRLRFGDNIKAALGPGTVIQGKLSFDSPVRIDGTLNGEVTSTSSLIVGEQGTVDAKVRVGELIVLGQVTGDIEASELIEIKAGGRIEADILSQRLIIKDGGFFEGQCSKG